MDGRAHPPGDDGGRSEPPAGAKRENLAKDLEARRGLRRMHEAVAVDDVPGVPPRDPREPAGGSQGRQAVLETDDIHLREQGGCAIVFSCCRDWT